MLANVERASINRGTEMMDSELEMKKVVKFVDEVVLRDVDSEARCIHCNVGNICAGEDGKDRQEKYKDRFHVGYIQNKLIIGQIEDYLFCLCCLQLLLMLFGSK